MVSRLMLNSTKEFRKGNLQGLGNLLDIDQRDVPFTPDE
jgi:hypothetical protein